MMNINCTTMNNTSVDYNAQSRNEFTKMQEMSTFTVEMPMPTSKEVYYALEIICNGNTSEYGKVLAEKLLTFNYAGYTGTAYFHLDNDDACFNLIYPLAEQIVDNHPEMEEWYIRYKGNWFVEYAYDEDIQEMMPFFKRHPAIMEYILKESDCVSAS